MKAFVEPSYTLALHRHNSKNSKKIFPGKELHGLCPNFHIHVSVSDLYIPLIGPPILLENSGKYVDRYWEYINRSQTQFR